MCLRDFGTQVSLKVYGIYTPTSLSHFGPFETITQNQHITSGGQGNKTVLETFCLYLRGVWDIFSPSRITSCINTKYQGMTQYEDHCSGLWYLYTHMRIPWLSFYKLQPICICLKFLLVKHLSCSRYSFDQGDSTNRTLLHCR